MPKQQREDQAIVDCLIVGGGPAGLTAATYLGRYRRSVVLVDEGESRAALIPESHNYPGYTGIAGPDLLKLLRGQATEFGARLLSGRVETLERNADQRFSARFGSGSLQARAVILATGIIDLNPPLDGVSVRRQPQ